MAMTRTKPSREPFPRYSAIFGRPPPRATKSFAHVLADLVHERGRAVDARERRLHTHQITAIERLQRLGDTLRARAREVEISRPRRLDRGPGDPLDAALLGAQRRVAIPASSAAGLCRGGEPGKGVLRERHAEPRLLARFVELVKPRLVAFGQLTSGLRHALRAFGSGSLGHESEVYSSGQLGSIRDPSSDGARARAPLTPLTLLREAFLMMACIDEDTLAALVERTLDSTERGRAEEHLDRCAACRKAVAEMTALRSVSTTSGEDAPPSAPGDHVASTGAPAPSSARAERTVLPRGRAVSRYVVLDLVGAGALGVVYAAYDPDLDRKVALKLVRSDRATADRAAEARGRLLREAQAMARLSHANVVSVFDVGVIDDEVFMAMELVVGQTLTGWLRERPRSWPEVVQVFERAGRGLAAAHGAGLVHRDFKPDNVLVGADGRVLVTDFGLARAFSEPLPSAGAPPPADFNRSLTRTGALVGRPRTWRRSSSAARP